MKVMAFGAPAVKFVPLFVSGNVVRIRDALVLPLNDSFPMGSNCPSELRLVDTSSVDVVLAKLSTPAPTYVVHAVLTYRTRESIIAILSERVPDQSVVTVKGVASRISPMIGSKADNTAAQRIAYLKEGDKMIKLKLVGECAKEMKQELEGKTVAVGPLKVVSKSNQSC